jgi:hypothetical protein
MLSIVHAAEAQFRFDTATRSREHAILVAIRDRRLALSGVEGMVTPIAAPHRQDVLIRRTATAWPRPIHARPIVRPLFAAT